MLKCLILLALGAVLDAARFKNCDYTFYKDAGGYLKLQEMPLTFGDAKQRCALEGSILASPINDGMKLAMIGIMNNTKVNFSKMPVQVFTGISKKYDSLIFSSVEGIRLSNIPHTWAPNEPDNMNNKESCIAMLPDGTMADVKCYKPLPHFCFLEEVGVKELNTCGLRNKDYKLDITTGSCYKFHRTKLVYDDAAKVCEEEGGHLVIINGDTEAEVVKNLFPKADILEEDKYALIGFRLNNNTGKWMTLQGETIEEAGYAKWAPEEPNNAGNNQYCGAVHRSGKLDDIFCNLKWVFFICEKDPEIILC